MDSTIRDPKGLLLLSPMSRNVLSISWVNGKARGVHARGTKVMAQWIHPEPVEDVAALAALIPEAAAQTKFNGRDVVFVIENRNVLYHLQEAPECRKSLIPDFLQRKVDQNRFFEEEPASFGMGQPIHVKTGQRFLLTLLPRNWVTQLRDACIASRLWLSGIFAPATILSHYIRHLEVPATEPVILGTRLGETLCLVVGKKDQVWFARSVVLSGSSALASDVSYLGQSLRVAKSAAPRESERLEQEINRTRLFSQQQFETNIQQIWALGASAQSCLADVRLPDGLKLQLGAIEDEEFFLAREAAQLPPKAPGNITSQWVGGEVQQKRIAALSVGVGFLFAVALSGWIFHQARHQELELLTLQSQIQETRDQNQETIRFGREVFQKQTIVSAVGSAEDPPIPELFLLFLGAKLPDEFILTRLDMKRSTNLWQFRLEGRQQETSEGQFKSIEGLELQLTNSFFRALISGSTRLRVFQENPGDGRVPPQSTVAIDGERPFFVEGYIP